MSRFYRMAKPIKIRLPLFQFRGLAVLVILTFNLAPSFAETIELKCGIKTCEGMFCNLSAASKHFFNVLADKSSSYVIVEKGLTGAGIEKHNILFRSPSRIVFEQIHGTSTFKKSVEYNLDLNVLQYMATNRVVEALNGECENGSTICEPITFGGSCTIMRREHAVRQSQ